MGKIVRPILTIAAIAVNFIPGVGQIASAALFAATGVAASAGAIAAGLAVGAALVPGGRKPGGAALTGFDPKSINIDPAARRKMVFGRTVFPLDLRYAEPSGTNQEFIDYIFALAGHKSDAIEEIYIEDRLAWTAAGGAQGIYSGYLTVEVILEAGAGAFHTVNAGATWGSSRRMTGCTTMKMRVRRSDISKNNQSPFANGLSGRMSVIGRGMPVYDPALDSTVPGGSGSQRANDCTTWAYTASSVIRGNNPALQLLAYLLSWRINGVPSVGVGMPAARLDLASFATAAARCDEAVTLLVGGSQRRYESGMAFSDADDPEAVINTLLAAMNAELTDDGGRLGLRVAVNDLTAVATFTDDDFVSGYSWQPVPPIEQQFTLVRGQFQQPNAPSLFGPADYPEVAIPRATAAPRPLVLPLIAVQDVRRAERIAKQVAQRNLYMGTFSVTVGIRGWQLRRNMVVAITSTARAWSAKLFRVRSLKFNFDGTVDVVFREENAAVYAWANDETGAVSPVTPTLYDPRNQPWVKAVADASLWPNISGTGKPDDNATYAGERIVNPGLTAGADGLEGWVLDPGITRVVGLSTDPGNYLQFATGAIRNVLSNGGAVRPIGGGPLFWRVTTFRVAAASASMTAVFNWFRADGTAASTAFTSVSILPTVANVWQRQSGRVVPPADAVSFRLDFSVSTTGGVVNIAVPSVSNAEAGADVTATQPIVSRLSPATGQAADNFTLSTGLPPSQIVARGQARNGDAVTFSPALAAIPEIIFLPGGNTGTAGQNQRIAAEGLTASGFTMRATTQAVTPGTTVTDTGATAGGAGEPDLIMNRSSGSAPFDGFFTFSVSVDVGEIAPGEPGSIGVGLYVRQSGAWTQRGSFSRNASGTAVVAISPGAVDFGAGSEFGIELTFAAGAGTAISSFNSVSYTPGTVTESSLTPAGSSPIPFLVVL